jgi:hypothetical protein
MNIENGFINSLEMSSKDRVMLVIRILEHAQAGFTRSI